MWGDKVAQVAINGTAINQSVRSGYIKYQYGVWNPHHTIIGYDEDGSPIYQGGYDWYSSTSNAIINGSVSCNNKVYANGTSIAKAGDCVDEAWTNSGFKSPNRNISPGKSGSGKGVIDSNANNSKVFINGNLAAIKGSSVTTHLSTATTLNAPVANKVFIG